MDHYSIFEPTRLVQKHCAEILACSVTGSHSWTISARTPNIYFRQRRVLRTHAKGWPLLNVAIGYCQYMDVTTHKILLNKVKFTLKHFANCKTYGVVYLLQCECTCFYVGKTKTEFWHRAYRHILSMQSCNPDLPLGHHVLYFHGGIFSLIKFLTLDRVHPGLRGDNWNKILLQREQRWIYKLNATSFPGLNEMISFKPFLEGFVSGGPEHY